MKSAINLLPPAIRRQQMLRRRCIEWTSVAIAVLLTVWAARWVKLREHRELDQALAAVAREGRPIRSMFTEIVSMRQQLGQLQQQETIAEELEQQRQIVTLFGLIGQAANNSAGRLRVTHFDLVDLQRVDADGEHRNEKSQNSGLTVKGDSLDRAALADFHDALMRSGLFADVRLIKSNERDVGGVALFDYEVRCEL
jgi:hypothetical protein